MASTATFPAKAPESYRVYARLREGVALQAATLGDGRNLFSPGAPLMRWLGERFASLELAGAASRYEESDGARQVIASAMSVALDIPDLIADDVYLTAGATEAVSMGFQAARAGGCTQTVLPLPGYFGFEMSAMRWGIPIAGYFRPDTPNRHQRGIDLTQFEGLVVDVAPNGVTGHFAELTPTTCSTALLTVVDCVYCAHGLSPDLISHVATHLHSCALHRGLWAFTASKDLGLPGLRTGFLLTRTASVKLAAALHRLEISYTTSVVQSNIAALYALTLASQRIRRDQGISANAAVECAYAAVAEDATTGVLHDFLAMDALVEALHELDSLTQLCIANWHLAEHWANAVGAELLPSVGGYSILMRLPRKAIGKQDIVKWVNHIGRDYHLKVNPSIMYGGNVDWWKTLYGTEWYIRINLSSPPERLQKGLQILGRALAA